jgi:hypothetical protein
MAASNLEPMTDEESTALELSFEEEHCPDDPPNADGDYRWYDAAGGLGLEVWSDGDWNFAGTIEPAANGKRGYRVFAEDRVPQRAASLGIAKLLLLQLSGAAGKELS